jgi:hypothetical protein
MAIEINELYLQGSKIRFEESPDLFSNVSNLNGKT